MIDYNDLIGKPFDEVNFNCYDLAREVFKRNGITIPKVNAGVSACRAATNQEMEKQGKEHWELIEQPEVPCGVIFLSSNPDFANHVGVYIGRGLIIHNTINCAVAVDRLAKWKYKIIGYYRYVGNNNKD